MEWLAQYASFDLTNEQKLALVFVREVGVIDNATYRQLDSSITHASARLEIHKLCNLGFIEKKGQGRNTYYIRTSKVVFLEERLRPQDERLRPQDERLRPQDEKIPPQHGILGEKIPPLHGIAFTGNLYALTFWIIAINQVTISIQVSLLFSCLLQQSLLPTRKLGL